MGKINWGRVFLGGLLAYVVIAVLGGIWWFLFFQGELDIMMRHLQRPFELTPTIVVVWNLVFLLAAMSILWVYASIRPRYGPGPKTAARAGVAVWFILVLADVWWTSLGLFHIGLLVISVTISLPIFVAAAVVGAWKYKE